jgi:hypothetical protein
MLGYGAVEDDDVVEEKEGDKNDENDKDDKVVVEV